MRFLYVFGLMFLSIFGAAMLVRTLYAALLSRGSPDLAAGKRDVYVWDGEGLSEFLENAERAAFIGRVFVMTDSSDNIIIVKNCEGTLWKRPEKS